MVKLRKFSANVKNQSERGKKMLNKMKVLTVALGAAMMASLVAGCGGKTETQQAEPGDNTGTETQQTVKYPESITYWVQLNANAAATMKSFNEIAAYKELEKITGTKVEFLHPPAGQERDQFNLMLASDKLPDVIEYTWSAAPKGPDTLIKEKRILRLNELIEKYAPNLTKILNEFNVFIQF